VAIARLGQEDQRIVYATLAQMAAVVEHPGAEAGAGAGEDGEEAERPDVIDLGPPLHSLVLVGDTHPLETEVLREMYMWQGH
jgi:diphthamide biosynthesis methyltransferase